MSSALFRCSLFLKEKYFFVRKIQMKMKTLFVEILLDKLVDDVNNDLMQNKFHFVEFFLEKFFSKKQFFFCK